MKRCKRYFEVGLVMMLFLASKLSDFLFLPFSWIVSTKVQETEAVHAIYMTRKENKINQIIIDMNAVSPALFANSHFSWRGSVFLWLECSFSKNRQTKTMIFVSWLATFGYLTWPLIARGQHSWACTLMFTKLGLSHTHGRRSGKIGTWGTELQGLNQRHRRELTPALV